MAKFNTKQFIDAMKKNGYRKAHGTWVQFKGSKVENGVYAACAGGQAFLNLGVNPKHVSALYNVLPYGFAQNFTIPNDQSSQSVTKIADSLFYTDWYSNPTDFEIPEDYLK